jgi:hypothetical protein
MFSTIRKRLTWPNVALTLALVFAMTGGAYAAKKYLITSTKQISPKVLKELRGKAGPAGAPGTPGAQGPAGSGGLQGSQGPQGAAGANGSSVSSKEVKAGETACSKQGGSEFTAASGKTFACNGKAGGEGPEGSPWTAGGVLPPEKTETGTWAATAGTPAIKLFGGFAEGLMAPISFPIPLKAGLDEAHVRRPAKQQTRKPNLATSAYSFPSKKT